MALSRTLGTPMKCAVGYYKKRKKKKIKIRARWQFVPNNLGIVLCADTGHRILCLRGPGDLYCKVSCGAPLPLCSQITAVHSVGTSLTLHWPYSTGATLMLILAALHSCRMFHPLIGQQLRLPCHSTREGPEGGVVELYK